MRVVIRGRVQGVCFRAYTQEAARSLGVGGWVRNRLDGAVEALLEGPPERVDQMVAWCWKGSPYARVSSVDVREEPGGEASGPGDPEGFRIRD